MATEDEYDTQWGNSVDLIESAILDTIIPASTEFDLEESLNAPGEQEDQVSSTPLSRIAQRQSVFFDETVDVYVVLQTPLFDEHTLRLYLDRLAITLEVQVVGIKQDNYEGPPQQETIYSASVQEADNQDPLIIVQQAEEHNLGKDEGHMVIVWKLPVQLQRPQRLRPQSPTIIFSATATFKSDKDVDTIDQDDEYMPSGMPSGMNLLASLSSTGYGESSIPYLSSTSITRLPIPNRSSRSMPRNLKSDSKRTLRIFPAFTARVRYAKSNSTPSNPSVIASVDIDTTAYAAGGLMLEKVEFVVSDAVVTDLNQTELMNRPIKCYALDNLTFLYQLSPSELASMKTTVKPVYICITARVTVSPVCHPLISFLWTTSIDFSIPVNPGFAAPTSAIVGRENRPSNLSISSSTFDTLPILATSKPDALPNSELQPKQHNRTTSMSDFGVTITFTISSSIPKVGKPFTWEVFVVNRSDRVRRLGLLILPHHRRPMHHRHSTQGPPAMPARGRVDQTSDVAEAILDETTLHELTYTQALEPTELICLNADIRIGPLATNACQSLDLQFLPLRAGVLSLDCVRVFDLGTQEHVEIRDLPSIMVENVN